MRPRIRLRERSLSSGPGGFQVDRRHVGTNQKGGARRAAQKLSDAGDAGAAAGAAKARMEAKDAPRRRRGRPRNPSNVPRETDTELQAAARAIFRRLQMKTLQQVLADVGFEAGVCVNKNDFVDALLALPPTKLAWITEGTTANAGVTGGGCCGGHNNGGFGGGCDVPRPSRPATIWLMTDCLKI